MLFSFFLKGKKLKFNNFFTARFSKFKDESILIIDNKDLSFKNKIHLFFDKNSALFDKTKIEYNLDLEISPEDIDFGIFDFSKKIDMYHSASMLSSRITNANLLFTFILKKQEFNDKDINIFLRYSFLAFASKKIDFIFLDLEPLNSLKLKSAFEYMNSFLSNCEIVNFSNAKDLYVLTIKKGKEVLDIIWTSEERLIELTDIHKVYDKFGTELTKNIKISNSPIYAFHK